MGVDMEPRQQLFLSRAHGQVSPYRDQDQFYSRRDELNQIVAEAKGRNGSERLKFLKESRPVLNLRGLLKSSERQLKMLRKQRDRIYALDLPPAELDEKMDDIELRMEQVIDRFNLEYSKAKEKM